MAYGLSPRGIKNLKSHETWGGKNVSKSPKKIDIKKDRSVFTYKKYGNKWYLNTLVIDTEFDASLVFFGMVQSQKSSLVFHSERIVTAIDTLAVSNNISSNINDIGSIPTLQNFIKKDFEDYNELNEEKWATVNFIRSDTSIASIAQQLKFNNQHWEINTKQQALEKAIAKNNYTSRQLTEDVDYLKETLEKIHPGLNDYTNKGILDNEFEQLKNRLKKRNTETEFFRLVSPLIEKIHCGHTMVSPSLVQSEYQKLYGKLFPLDLWMSGDSAFVTTSYDNIMKGSKVMKINGLKIPEILERIKSGIAADGYNITYKEFLLKNTFPSLLAKHFPTAKDTFEVKIQNLHGQVKNLKIPGKPEDQKVSKKTGNAGLSVYDSLQTAMLSIPSFSTAQDLSNFLQKSFTEIERKGIKNLIIDLRNNQGGRDEYGLLLYSYLAPEPFRFYKNISVATIDTTVLSRLYFHDIPFNSAIPDYVTNIQKENGSYLYTSHPNLGLHQPKERPFKGAVYILINGGTYSAAAEFASIAHNNKRAVFIGEEAGGGYYGNSSLGTPTVTLPNSQIRITVPLAKYELAVSKNNPAGHGVIPDHQTHYFAFDILQNRDKDLEFCLRIISKDKK